MGVLADSWVELAAPEQRLRLQSPRIVAPLVIPLVIPRDIPRNTSRDTSRQIQIPVGGNPVSPTVEDLSVPGAMEGSDTEVASFAKDVPVAKRAPVTKQPEAKQPEAKQSEARKPSPAAKDATSTCPESPAEGVKSSLSRRKPAAALRQKRQGPVAQKAARSQVPAARHPSRDSAGSHRVLRMWLIAIWVLALACWGLVFIGLRF